MTTVRPAVQILVCGNADRRDDGAALWAFSHSLTSTAFLSASGVNVTRCGQLDVDDLVQSDGPVLIVDAAIGVDPGEVVTLDFDQLLANPKNVAPHSSHALPIDQVIGIARSLRDAPLDGLFVGIGATDVGFGHEMSAPVRESMGEFVSAINRALMRLSPGSLATARGW